MTAPVEGRGGAPGGGVFAQATLDERGRCCGRKPVPYKRPARLFCSRCCRQYAPTTGLQEPNWAWLSDGTNGFRSRYPDHDYTELPYLRATRPSPPEAGR
jgi:hypothetical protein